MVKEMCIRNALLRRYYMVLLKKIESLTIVYDGSISWILCSTFTYEFALSVNLLIVCTYHISSQDFTAPTVFKKKDKCEKRVNNEYNYSANLFNRNKCA